MPLPRNAGNDKARIDDRRAKVAALYLEGKSQAAIGRAVGVSQVTVGKDLAALRAGWRASAAADYSSRLGEELAKVDHVEATAWDGWDRSRGDITAKTRRVEAVPSQEAGGGDGGSVPVPGAGTRPGPVRTVEGELVRGGLGDPRFLDRVAWCIETRLKLMGAFSDRRAGPRQPALPWDLLWEVKSANT